MINRLFHTVFGDNNFPNVHDIRATVCTHMSVYGFSDEEISKFIGHESGTLVTNKHYIDKDLREAHRGKIKLYEP